VVGFVVAATSSVKNVEYEIIIVDFSFLTIKNMCLLLRTLICITKKKIILCTYFHKTNARIIRIIPKAPKAAAAKSNNL
jgi:hypothetical protein